MCAAKSTGRNTRRKSGIWSREHEVPYRLAFHCRGPVAVREGIF